MALSRKKAVFAALAVAALLTSAACLTGCAADPHQTVSSDESCKVCHGSTSRVAYTAPAGTLPSGAHAAGANTQFTVSAADNDTVSLCSVVFADAQYTYPVPVRKGWEKVTDGVASFQLPEGLWMIIVGNEVREDRLIVLVEGQNGPAELVFDHGQVTVSQ